MPPKKKKNKENPFYYFMIEKRPELEKRLNRKVTMAELPELIYQEWKALSEKQKEIYKNKCSSANKDAEKYDSRGIPLSQIQKEIDTEQVQREEMIKSIKRRVGMLQAAKAIPNETFCVICITHYICTDDGTFVPAEIGICQFSLAKGILLSYHKILPAKIPLGYKYEAIQHSQQTHQLLLNQFAEAGNFKKDLEQFIIKNAGGDLVPNLYSLEEFMSPVDHMIKQFKLSSTVNVYSLDCLYKHLYSASLIDIPESVATEMLTSCIFDYVPSLACSWHQEVAPDAGKFCALSLARRWIFNMFHNLRLEDSFGIHPKKGKHFPDNSDTSTLSDSFESLTLKSPLSSPLSEPTSPELSTTCSSDLHKIREHREQLVDLSALHLSTKEGSTCKEMAGTTVGVGVARNPNDGRPVPHSLFGIGMGRGSIKK